MKKATKITLSFLLVIVFMFACVIGLIGLFFAAWMHTYNALTKEVVVAEVIMYPIQSDDQGDYIEIEFTPIIQQSALTTIINPGVAETSAVGVSEKYKLYGDTVNIGGPMVKFHNHLILMNFETVYKLARIQGVYNLDIEQEKNRKVFSMYDLNGGFDSTWWNLNDNEDKFPYSQFVDRVQFSVPGEPGFKSKDEAKVYEIVVTKDGFAWNLVERVQVD